MKTKVLFSSAIFSMLLFGTFTIKLYSQEPAEKAVQPVIEIKDIPVQQALVIKAEVPSKDIGPKMGEMYGKLYGYIGKNNIQPSGVPFAVYYAFDPQGNTTFEAGLPVSTKLTDAEGITYKEYPAMRVVTTLYTGAYENMMPVYTQLYEYIGKNNLKATGISWEVYLTDPGQVASPKDNKTMIYLLIE
jgi:effector-binding domain-containing protein